MERKFFGKLDTGIDIYEYILSNSNATISIIDFGLAIRKFDVFGIDIVGGYDNLQDYIDDDSHQGAIIGRVANRIGGASFKMDGKIYSLPKNDGNNTLHGGVGFDRRKWEFTCIEENQDYSKITFSYISEDMEEGFPSKLNVSVSYSLIDTSLVIEYTAIPESKTPIALTNHAYFNLDGLGGDILSHKAEIFAKSYTEVGEDLIPTGRHLDVVNTSFDFNTPNKIGARISDILPGYDHNFILNPKYNALFSSDLQLPLIARVSGKTLKMSVYTDQPGVQFYIGNFLGGEPNFKGGIKRIKHGAFCLETQTEPNCINSGIGFYDKGDIYQHKTVYKIERLD